MILGITLNIGVLFFFKYVNFFIDNINHLFADFIEKDIELKHLSVILPLGLSFHTFQAISYIVEVYRKKQKAEEHFGIYALYIMFYPQLVAGPIERPQNILPQLHTKKEFKIDNLIVGLKLIVWGLFKKVVVADTLAVIVNQYYDNVTETTGWQLILATYCFAIQIYCDFSGYSDIAVGTAKTMGFDLIKNFNSPYFSKNISEFWKRWHISLSSWFKDYIYIPLGGNRKIKINWIRNLVIVFILSGLWHGANWTFIMWGAIHAFYLIFSILTKKIRNRIRLFLFNSENKLSHFIDGIITFNLVTYAWIYFRANSIADAIIINKKIIGAFENIYESLIAITHFFTLSQWFVLCSFGVALFYEKNKRLYTYSKNIFYKNIYFIILLLLIVVFGKSTQEQFIYFQF